MKIGAVSRLTAIEEELKAILGQNIEYRGDPVWEALYQARANVAFVVDALVMRGDNRGPHMRSLAPCIIDNAIKEAHRGKRA